MQGACWGHSGDSWAPFTTPSLPGAVTVTEMFPMSSTPPPTQAPALTAAGTPGVHTTDDGLKCHDLFYEMSENLQDAVILRVRDQLVVRTKRNILTANCYGPGWKCAVSSLQILLDVGVRVLWQHVLVAGVCADLLLSYQRNSVRVIGGGNGGDEGGSRRF